MMSLAKARSTARAYLYDHAGGLAAAWTVLIAALIFAYMGVSSMGCSRPEPARPPKPPITAENVTDPLARAGVRQDQIIAQSPPVPVVELATATKGDLGDAGNGLQDLIESWGATNAAYEKQVAGLKDQLAKSNSVADQRYRAFMRTVQGACALGAIAGFGGMLFITGPLRAAAGAIAAACAVGFVGILISVQIETFMDRYGLIIAAVALALLLLIGLYALWAHVRASRKLAELVPFEAISSLTGATSRIVARTRLI